MSMHGVDEGWQWADKPEIDPRAEALIRSDWADRTAWGIAGPSDQWRPYADDLAQEARYQMWQAALAYEDRGFTGDSIEGFLKQRGRWRIINIIQGEKNFVGTLGRKSPTNRNEDKALAEMRIAIQNFRQAEHREPTAAELGKILGIARTTAITRKANLGKVAYDGPVRVRSLEDMLESVGFEVVETHDYIEQVLTSYHDGEIAEALSTLPAPWQEYLRLRFWEGYSHTHSSAEVQIDHKTWARRIAPALAEALAHLVVA